MVCEVMSVCVLVLSSCASPKGMVESVASLRVYLGCRLGISRRISMGTYDVTLVSLESSRGSLSVSQRRHGRLYDDVEGVSRASGSTRGLVGAGLGC